MSMIMTAYKPTEAARRRRALLGNPLLLTEVHVHPGGRAVALYGAHPTMQFGSLQELLGNHELETSDLEIVP